MVDCLRFHLVISWDNTQTIVRRAECNLSHEWVCWPMCGFENWFLIMSQWHCPVSDDLFSETTAIQTSTWDHIEDIMIQNMIWVKFLSYNACSFENYLSQSSRDVLNQDSRILLILWAFHSSNLLWSSLSIKLHLGFSWLHPLHDGHHEHSLTVPHTWFPCFRIICKGSNS
jgi:hypothetical protein